MEVKCERGRATEEYHTNSTCNAPVVQSPPLACHSPTICSSLRRVMDLCFGHIPICLSLKVKFDELTDLPLPVSTLLFRAPLSVPIPSSPFLAFFHIRSCYCLTHSLTHDPGSHMGGDAKTADRLVGVCARGFGSREEEEEEQGEEEEKSQQRTASREEMR